jgi:hypothetical protein
LLQSLEHTLHRGSHGDSDLDVYGLTADGLVRNPDDWVWINHNLDFTGIRAPHAGGAADDVIALDRQADGRAEFLVLNGRKNRRSGPVQLIQLVRP